MPDFPGPSGLSSEIARLPTHVMPIGDHVGSAAADSVVQRPDFVQASNDEPAAAGPSPLTPSAERFPTPEQAAQWQANRPEPTGDTSGPPGRRQPGDQGSTPPADTPVPAQRPPLPIEETRPARGPYAESDLSRVAGGDADVALDGRVLAATTVSGGRVISITNPETHAAALINLADPGDQAPDREPAIDDVITQNPDLIGSQTMAIVAGFDRRELEYPTISPTPAWDEALVAQLAEHGVPAHCVPNPGEGTTVTVNGRSSEFEIYNTQNERIYPAAPTPSKVLPEDFPPVQPLPDIAPRADGGPPIPTSAAVQRIVPHGKAAETARSDAVDVFGYYHDLYMLLVADRPEAAPSPGERVNALYTALQPLGERGLNTLVTMISNDDRLLREMDPDDLRDITRDLIDATAQQLAARIKKLNETDSEELNALTQRLRDLRATQADLAN